MKSFYSFLWLILMSFTVAAQEEPLKDSLENKIVALDEVLVAAIRVNTTIPITFSNIYKKEIAPRNLGQDIPILLNYLPGVVTTSDAGAGVGYTGIRIRGSDATRVNITINGIPYNDAESHGTFWVNLPDFASSLESLQLQRGVGTSTNGAGAFGASLNLLTDAVSENASGELSNAFGSFNTRKHTVKFSTGKLRDYFELAGRLSAIHSDGYIDRATADLKSYFLQASYRNENRLIKALLFGGHEITYQAWYGIDAETLKTNRTFNPSGIYTDGDGSIQFYEDEVDNYKQDHVQLHWNEKLNTYWNTNLSIHYTYGRGFFEQYREDENFSDYGFEPIETGDETINTTDLIRRRWLDNDFYGTAFSATYKNEATTFLFGGAWNRYNGSHFGEVLWARYASDSEIRDRYYSDYGLKTDVNFYSKICYNITEKLALFGDLQYRALHYKADGVQPVLVNDTFHFFNPKIGFSQNINPAHILYFSFAVAHREPNRTDYENGSPKPERLDDIELGWRYHTAKTKLNTNIYYMYYINQLVLTGELDDVGAPIRTNSGNSYRLGLEADAELSFSDRWTIRSNIAFSINKNIDFVVQRNGILENLGNTTISYAPNVVSGNSITYKPAKALQLSLLSKYVGAQYMSNIDAETSKLKGYFTNDFNIQYELKPQTIFKTITINGLLNNIFNKNYVSNGYYYTYDVNNEDGTVSTLEGAGYYPQAGIHFLLGATLAF